MFGKLSGINKLFERYQQNGCNKTENLSSLLNSIKHLRKD